VDVIRQVIYISQASIFLTESELKKLVKKFNNNNKIYSVTGALLYLENAFIQVIEGEDSVIGQLVDNLYADIRHRNIRILSDELKQVRYFQNWSMGLIKAAEADGPEILEALNLTSAINGDVTEKADTVLASQIFMMMHRLYDTSNALQRAQRPVD
jgi:hypothetical protein